MRIEHSGCTFESLGIGPNGHPVWPIDEYLVRSKHKKSVAERIRRLNPDGFVEGSRIRGRFFKPVSWRRVKKKCLRCERFVGNYRKGKSVHHSLNLPPWAFDRRLIEEFLT